MDQFHDEMLKAEETVTHQVLTSILRNIWTTELAPEPWKTVLEVKLLTTGEERFSCQLQVKC
jgi:hypothetical protein